MVLQHDPWPIVALGDAVDAGVERVGVKGWYLERLHHGGFRVPAAIIVEADAFLDSIRLARIDHRLARIWDAACSADASEISMLSRKARHLISQIDFSAPFRAALDHHLDRIADPAPSQWGTPDRRFAVRSSATLGAVSGQESAGVHATYLGVVGVDRVIARIHSCWASMYGEQALAMRARGLGRNEPSMAVIVQLMVDAEKSGIITPTATDSEVLVEATFGLGEPIISGAVEPDRYAIDRRVGEAHSVTIGRKQILLSGRPEVDGHEFATPDRMRARVLSQSELADLSELSTSIDQHFHGPHEVEWCIDDQGISVVQVRPVMPGHHIAAPLAEEFVSGIGIGEGWATGRVRIVDRYEELCEFVDGEILVASETAPEWTPVIQRAHAIVTDEGDATSHAARVAIETGIPAIVGAENATIALETGMYVTVDANRGWILPTVTFADAV